MPRPVTNTRLIYGLVPIVIVASAALALLQSSDQTKVQPTDWPAMTTTYDLHGQFFIIGDNPPATQTQTRRSTHTTKDSWIEVIIAAPDMVTRVGTFSDVGSYQKIENGQYITYDAVTGSTETETINERVTRTPANVP